MTTTDKAPNTTAVGHPSAVRQTTPPGGPLDRQGPPRWRWLLGAVVVLAVTLGGVWAATSPVLETTGRSGPATDDSGSAREQHAMVQAQHDAWIPRLVREREARLEAEHDSWSARLVRQRQERLEAQHDSGIARLLRKREHAGPGSAAR